MNQEDTNLFSAEYACLIIPFNVQVCVFWYSKQCAADCIRSWSYHIGHGEKWEV